MNRRNQKGFSLVELLVVVLIIVGVLGGGFLILSTGQSAWFTTDINIQLQENLRKSLEKATMEIRQTTVAQQQIFDNTGPGATDVIRFSMPVVCEAGNNLIDANGDVAYWGAPLTWGCTDSTCMDADNDCLTVDYSAVEYRLDNNSQLVRQVLNSVNNVVRTDVLAQNITDLQIQLNGSTVTLNITAQKATATNRMITGTTSTVVYLRN